MIWSNKELASALGVNIPNKKNFGNLQFNSTDVEEGDIFIALTGGNRDGHLFLNDAIERGASAVIVSQKINNIDQEKVILVEDTIVALKQLAEYKRSISKATFIGITGSVGKTSTKEGLKLMLEPFGKVFASRANFNNHLGVPLNLACLPRDTKFAIFELGMNHKGEILELTKLVKPDIAIITSIAEVHIGNFDSIQGIIEAKSEIFVGMQPESLVIINNENEEYAQAVSKIAKKNLLKNIYFFGLNDKSSSKLIDYKNVSSKSHLKYKLKGLRKHIKVTLPKLPEHFAHNFASNFLLINLLGLDLNLAAKALEKYIIKDGRGEIINVTKDGKKHQVICDYYASNPTSFIAALKSLSQINHPKKIIIMGDMLELGARAQVLHESVIPHIISSGAYKVILVGDIAPKISHKIPKNIEVFMFDNIQQALENMQSAENTILSNNELILIKGSRKLAMWKILTYFDK